MDVDRGDKGFCIEAVPEISLLDMTSHGPMVADVMK